jgi:hypothetical protein
MPMDDPEYAPNVKRMFEIAFEDLPRIPLYQPALNVAANGDRLRVLVPPPARRRPHHQGLSHGRARSARSSGCGSRNRAVPVSSGSSSSASC